MKKKGSDWAELLSTVLTAEQFDEFTDYLDQQDVGDLLEELNIINHARFPEKYARDEK